MINVNIHKNSEVKSLIDLYDGLLTASNYQLPIRSHLEQLSVRVLSGHENENPWIVFVAARKFGKKDMTDIFSSEFTLEDARNCVAQDFGYQTWDEVNKLGDSKPDAVFESLVDSLLAGELEVIKDAIAINPELVHQRSSYPHKSTLLHYTGSNGVEGYRQVVPSNLIDIVDSLLSSGADASLKAQVYGGCTAEVLMRTSKHPHDAGLFEELLEIFNRHQKATNVKV